MNLIADLEPIGFVGLIVPHAARYLFGEEVRMVLPLSLVLGAVFLVLADAVASTVLGASELPVGRSRHWVVARCFCGCWAGESVVQRCETRNKNEHINKTR